MQDIVVRRARAEELQRLASFIARFQHEPESRIAYFGDTPNEVAAEIEDWGASWPHQLLVAERDGAIVGVAGADVDAELGRAWLHGPFVEPTACDPLAAHLLTLLIAEVVPRNVRDLELAGDVANRRLRELAAREGFTRGVPSYVLEIGREAVSRLPPAGVRHLEQEQHDDFVALHDAVFPGTYYSGTQLIDQSARGEVIVVTLVEQDALVGYAAGRIDASGEGYLDFVGVAEEARGAGRGRHLVIAICQALLGRPGPSKVVLTVREDNNAARAIYGTLGFVQVGNIVGHQRRPSNPEREH